MIRFSCLALVATVLAPVASAQDVTGEWTGRYICGQGVTALNLTIVKAASPSALTATFRFGPLPENPEVPKGSYQMRGTFDSASRHVRLDGVRWIDAPSGYIMVGLDGHVNVSGSRITGSVPDMFPCSSFEVWRADPLVG
ncbi:MAG TPA: hypothetical protein PLH23_10130 [Hyphomonadaceae bacterium]|nr:hypothetical protein [Hyphomonadaceae bacterium]HPI48616.1 hypothetical protein [Hyphomonadaceae bacterium]